MRSGWVETTLGEVTAVNPGRLNGVSPDEVIRYVDISSVSWDGGIDVRSVAAMPFGQAPGRARRPINEKDVVVSTVRPRLRAMGQVPPSLAWQVASTGLCVLRSHDPQVILPDYVWQVVRHQPFTDWLVERETGSNYPAVRSSDIEAYRFLLPPIEDQRRIVDLMSHVDSLRTAISEEAARVFAALCAFRDSIWNVPQRVPLSQYCRVDGGLVDPTGEGQRDRPHVGTDRIVSGTGDLIGVQSASEDGVTSGKFEFSERHVVYSKIRPNLMKVAMPTFSGLCSADAYPLLSAPGVPRRWLQQLLLTTEFTTLAVSQSGRTKMPKINQSALMGLMVPDIADEAREEQAVVLDALDALRVGLGEELDALDRQRAAMLGSLLTGHHEIPCSYDKFIRDEGAA